MKQATYNITAVKNDTYLGATFTILVNGLPIDLAGAQIEMKIADETGSIVKTITSGSGITIKTDNSFSIDEFIVTLNPGKYIYDIQITFSTGLVKTYIKGRFSVIEDT